MRCVIKLGQAVLIAGALSLAGCIAPQAAIQAPEAPPAIRLFSSIAEPGSISVTIIDQRPRRVQAIADAADFDGVLFRLSNSVRLRQSQWIAAERSFDHTYQAVFKNLPIDNGNNYFLSVGLYDNVTTPTSVQDPGYGNAANKVGEGISQGFSIAAGTARSVTITINAVGEDRVGHDLHVINSSEPVLVAGAGQFTINTGVTAERNPDVTGLNIYLQNSAGERLADPVFRARFEWPADGPVSVTLPIPTAVDNYRAVVEAVKGEQVLSTRSRTFSVEAGESLEVKLE